MERARFERLVREALTDLQVEVSDRLENVDVLVEDWHASDQLGGLEIEEEDLLLGLYEGVPLTQRADYGMVLPDKITLFQKAIEAVCESDEEIVEEVRKTVVHEVAHHFGIDDERLEELEG